MNSTPARQPDGRHVQRPEAVALGASAGAIEALLAILPVLPADYCLPVLVVVHLPADDKSILADLFQARCHVKVQEAMDKEAIAPGTVYFAPPDYHLLVEPDRRLSLSSEEPVHFSRPSIDVLFETAAEAFGPGLIAIVLTGANADGAAGLRKVHRSGGTAIVQLPQQATVATMPQSALDACPEAHVFTLDEIAVYLLEVARPT